MKNDRLVLPMILLLLTVLVPSIGMVWMMREAVRNERAASDQRLRDVYQLQLQAAAEAVNQDWNRRLSEQIEYARKHSDTKNLGHRFAGMVESTGADSVLICNRNGDLLYPASQRQGSIVPEASNSRLKEAQQLEFEAMDYRAAAESYAEIAAEAENALLSARARQARVRCLLQIGERETAIESLKQQPEDVYDSFGRSFVAASELRLLELIDSETQAWNEVAVRLAGRLIDYENESMASSQRRFLMSRLQRLTENRFEFPLRDAEILAAEAAQSKMLGLASESIRLTSLPGVWCQRSTLGNAILLFRTPTLRKQLTEISNDRPLPPGIEISLIAPDESARSIVELSLGETFGDWRLGILMPDDKQLFKTTQQRNALHGWIACLVVAVTSVLAWLLSRSLRQRLRLAELKNDLVATVSHELKTPLASIRLLVDTLLASDDGQLAGAGKVKTRDYLQLISHENARLTRLIDGFLTFSRIEGGMQSFSFQTIDVRDVVVEATNVFKEHHDVVGGSLQINADEPSWISGDMDLLVTAVVNLLENAWKYSGQDRRIIISVDAGGDQVAISVRDNGIGMLPQDAKQVFNRFFQVDQRVARTRGGCGLGLSIVHAIVVAHGGAANVESQHGSGSTFTLIIPKLAAAITDTETFLPRRNLS